MKGTTPRARARRLHGLRHQAGFVREAVLVFIAVSIVGVVIIDIFSVYSAHRNLKDEAGNAALAAMHEYAITTSDPSAENAAENYLKGRRMTLVAIQPHHDGSITWYAVTASTTANTYVFRYIAKLPWGIGDWMDRQLHPQETGDNSP